MPETRDDQPGGALTRRRFLEAGAGLAGAAAASTSAAASASHKPTAIASAASAGRDAGSSPQPRVDIHHHILPDFYVKALASIGVNDITGVPFPSWRLERTLGAFTPLGITRAIVSISAPGVWFGDAPFARDLAREVNEYIASISRAHPAQLGGFASIPLPSVRDAIDETRYALDELGLEGVCLMTNHDGVYLGAPELDEYLAYLDSRAAVVFLHPTTPPPSLLPSTELSASILEFVFDTTRAIGNLLYTGALERYPNIRFIVAHLGGTIPLVAWRLKVLDNSKRETYEAYRRRAPQPVEHYLSRLYYDIAVSASPENLRTALALAGPERLLFGSDFPFLPPALLEQNTASVYESGALDPTALRALSSTNAERLFARPTEA